MADAQLRIVEPGEIPSLLFDPVDAETLRAAEKIVHDVREGGEEALRRYAEKFGEIDNAMPLLRSREELKTAFDELPEKEQQLLDRTAGRIMRFAEAQLSALREITIDIPGGKAGHSIAPVDIAGCYAPGGGFPLPSSVLMTAITARAAGVKTVLVASPNPTRVTLASAHAAGADSVLILGGAHAIAAMAYGVGVPRCDVIVGPGSKWVTAAKKIVSGSVAIDMLAGPSELAIIADDTADPATIAADLLAQAEHGYDSVPILITESRELIAKVNREIKTQLADLPTAETASASIAKGCAVLVESMDEAIAVSDAIASEHLEIITTNADDIAKRVRHYGAVFIGGGSAEVLGDYGAGPNHTLPTGGTARFTGGLSVFHFLRIRTWMRIDNLAAARELVEDARDLARHEFLEGHARSALRRLT